MITLNVIFTPQTPARLIPFALSLLQGSGIGIRLVDNGCRAEESSLLRDTCRVDDRITFHKLDADAPMEHGLALNHLFEQFPEPYFGMVDSDVIANGDFMAQIHPLLPGHTAMFSGSPVWATVEDTVVAKESTWIGARHRQFADGGCAGNTYFAIYDRAALESAWRSAPRGFGVHDSCQLPRGLGKEFAARDWRYVLFDTARVLNLQLLLDGHKLAHRILPNLHHVGGFSAQHFVRPTHRPMQNLAALAEGVLRIMRSSDGTRLPRLLDASRHHLFLTRSRRDPSHIQMNVRRREVISHVREVADAIRAGRELPATPDFDSGLVEKQVAALVSAVANHYPREHTTVGGMAADDHEQR